MSLEAIFGDLQALCDRITAATHGIVVLAGSGMTLPRTPGARGVPGTNDIIDIVRSEFAHHPDQLQRFDSALDKGANRYQAAFQYLQLTRSQDRVNHVIRSATLRAYATKEAARPLSKYDPNLALDEALCRSAEQHIGGWNLQPAIATLGHLITHFSGTFKPLVLTSNFDPLIEIAVRRAAGSAFSTALHNDGSISQTDAAGCHVVHIHGDWFRSDTLHTPAQLTQQRPRLGASLARLLRETTLLVVGYSGWDDIFMRSLAAVVEDSDAKLNVMWAFYDNDAVRVAAQNASLFELLRSGIGRGRVSFYTGINAHDLFPAVLRTLQSRVSISDKLRASYGSDLPSLIDASTYEPLPVTSRVTGAIVNVIHKVHYAPDTNSQYLSFYVPQVSAPDSAMHVCVSLLNRRQMFLEAEERSGMRIEHMWPGQNTVTITEAKFSNLIYFYVETDLPSAEEVELERVARANGLTVIIRGPRYVMAHCAELRDPASLGAVE